MIKEETLNATGEVKYFVYRMVPPGKVSYFFTINHEVNYAQDHPKVAKKIKYRVKNVEFNEVMEDDGRPPDSDEEEEETVFNYSIGVMNFRFGRPRPVLDEDYDEVNENCKPRPADKIYIRPRNRRPRTPWTFPISIFKDYVKESEEVLGKCFEFDWKQLKLPKMEDEEIASVKEEAKSGYKTIKAAFKYLSGIGTGSGGVFSIPLNTFTDFAKQVDLVNGKDIRFAESDTQFLTLNKRSKNTYLNPGVALVRFQFLEILLRLAFKRYEETKMVETKSEAVRMMINRNLLPYYGKQNAQKFRDERYWNEEVDNVYKSHVTLFEYLYKNYGGTHMKPGDQWFMTTDELENIFADAELINDQLVSRDIAVFYNLAMMTQVDEINKDRHLRMNFTEFLEGFGRCAEQISADPFERERLRRQFDEEDKKAKEKKEKKEEKEKKANDRTPLNNSKSPVFKSLNDSFRKEMDDNLEEMPQMSLEERKAQPLFLKIENILPRIYINCTNNAFKEKWEWPMIDPYTGLYVEPSKKKKFKKTATARNLNGQISKKNLLGS